MQLSVAVTLQKAVRIIGGKPSLISALVELLCAHVLVTANRMLLSQDSVLKIVVSLPQLLLRAANDSTITHLFLSD